MIRLAALSLLALAACYRELPTDINTEPAEAEAGPFDPQSVVDAATIIVGETTPADSGAADGAPPISRPPSMATPPTSLPSQCTTASESCSKCRIRAIATCASKFDALRLACEVQYLCIQSACSTSTYEAFCSCASTCLPIQGECVERWEQLNRCTATVCSAC